MIHRYKIWMGSMWTDGLHLITDGSDNNVIVVRRMLMPLSNENWQINIMLTSLTILKNSTTSRMKMIATFN